MMMKKIIYFTLLPILILSIIFIIFNRIKKYKEDVNNVIISWCIADIDGDDILEALVILGTGKTIDTGEKYGERLEIHKDYEFKGDKLKLKRNPDISFDMSSLKPMKVQAGDINGDMIAEIAICVYKETEAHKVMAKRPFFYALENEELIPVYLGSRLARPFLDYILCDIDLDGIDEIISIEYLEDGRLIIAAYDWIGFGFEVKAMSDGLIGEMLFTDGSVVRYNDGGMDNDTNASQSITIDYDILLDNESVILIEKERK